MTKYALDLADEIGVRGADRELLRKGSLLHDIGKMSMPDAILNKPGRLTPDEYDVIKQHPLNGVQIVEPLQSLRDAIPLIRWHHERLDGRGYPDGLSGEAIPFLVRILSVADVYDALASERPYRAALPLQESLNLLRADASSRRPGFAPRRAILRDARTVGADWSPPASRGDGRRALG